MPRAWVYWPIEEAENVFLSLLPCGRAGGPCLAGGDVPLSQQQPESTTGTCPAPGVRSVPSRVAFSSWIYGEATAGGKWEPCCVIRLL